MGRETVRIPNVIGLLVNPHKANVVEYTKKILDFAKSVAWKCFISEEDIAETAGNKEYFMPENMFSEKADIVMALGGDGTILRAVRCFSRSMKPILGINLGGLGFLSESAPEHLEETLLRLSKGSFRIQERMAIECNIDNKNESFIALNDIVVSRESISRLIELSVTIDGEYLTSYNADGLIISTPTGSTAHSLSAGGPILSPNTEVILLTPICPHTLTNRPLIINRDAIIRICMRSCDTSGLITIDGQTVLPINSNEVIEIKRAQIPVKLISFDINSYYEILCKKLNWGGKR